MNLQTALRTASSRAVNARMAGFDNDALIDSFSASQKKAKVRAKVKKQARRES